MNKIAILKHYCRFNSNVGAVVVYLVLLFVFTFPDVQLLPIVKDHVGFLRLLLLVMACSFGALAGIHSFLPSFIGLIMVLAAAIIFGEATAMVFLLPVGMFSLPASIFGYFFGKFEPEIREEHEGSTKSTITRATTCTKR